MSSLLKLKIKYYSHILNTEKFKGIFLFCLFGAFISSFDLLNNISYEEAILSYFSSNLFQLFVFTILFISSIFTYSLFNSNNSFIIRYKNKNDYFNKLLSTISIINIIVYLELVLIGLTIITIKYFNTLSFSFILSYQIPFVVYNIYSIIKYFLIVNILINICVVMYKLFNKFVGGGCFILFILIKDIYPYSIDIINNIFDIKLFFGYYLYPFEYSSFLLEILCFLIFFSVLYFGYKLLKNITLRKNIFIDC